LMNFEQGKGGLAAGRGIMHWAILHRFLVSRIDED
jgi:hypothetical protein